jgi:UDP-2,3-diacylglucosamine pyrophosphatase LpxH
MRHMAAAPIMKTWAIINDLQIPFQDRRVLNQLVLPFIKELRPNGIVLNGDIVDCYSISDFDKNPTTRATLSTEIYQAQKLMEQLASIPEKVWIGGNHEDRLRRLVWRQPALLASVDAKTRDKLVKVLDFPEMFGLGEHGFKWKPYGDYLMLGKLLVTHGSVVRRHSAESGRAHLDKYGSSVIIGHTHRGGISYKTDVRGVHAAYENFCLCSLKPEYVQSPNWQHGFAIVQTWPNGLFNVQQLPILSRRLFVHGNRVHTAKAAA